MRSFFGYPIGMRRWICALLLILFTTNVGFAAHGSLMRAIPDGQQTSVQAMEASTEVVEAVTRCCMEKQAKGQGAPCLVDCTFAGVQVDIAFPPRQQDYGDAVAPAVLSRGVGAVFRPPIA